MSGYTSAHSHSHMQSPAVHMGPAGMFLYNRVMLWQDRSSLWPSPPPPPPSPVICVHTLPTDGWLTARSKEIPQESIAAPWTHYRWMEAEDIGSILKKKDWQLYRAVLWSLEMCVFGGGGVEKKVCPGLRTHFILLHHRKIRRITWKHHNNFMGFFFQSF